MHVSQMVAPYKFQYTRAQTTTTFSNGITKGKQIFNLIFKLHS